MHAGVDVYLLPAVVGGGLGDIEEVLAVGRYLERAGYRSTLYRRGGRPLPRSVEGPWAWPRSLERRGSLRRRSLRALTISPSWGVSAAEDRPGPYGRGGPWQEEAHAIENAYGRERTVHVSLEEFARTWTSRRETLERWREGGRPARTIRRLARSSSFAREARRWHDAYRKFRGFDRPNVVHLYATFAPSPAFAREFPEAVQCGPAWPHLYERRMPLRTHRRSAWTWYASPASAERLWPAIVAGLSESSAAPFLWIRSPRPWRTVPPPDQGRLVSAELSPARWRQRFASASLRIVTGSRTLLEAMELGGPFLYFNGVLGDGRRRRRHRPDKIEALARALIAQGSGEPLVRDLRDFARGRNIRATVHRAACHEGPWRRFPRGPWVSGFRAPYDEAGRVVLSVAEGLIEGECATDLVRSLREHARRGPNTASG